MGWCHQHAKDQLHRSFLSWDIAKILHIYYFEYFRHAWPDSSYMIVSIAENFDVYLHQKSITSLTFFLRKCKDFANFFFLGTFGMAGLVQQDWYHQLVEKFDVYLHAKNQLDLFSYLRYCQHFAKLLLQVLLACLAMVTNDISLYKTLMSIFMQKIKFTPPLFLEILLRYCKLGILDTLGMHSHTHQN